MMTAAPLLQTERLTVDVRVGDQTIRLLDSIDLAIPRARRVALVGESGSGKSVLARAILRLDPRYTVSGRVMLDGTPLTDLPERQMRGVRGRRIGMVFQDALTALNPVLPIGVQVMEPLLIHGVPRHEARARAIAVLEELGVQDAARRMTAAVHEFSGGMRQRVLIATALAAGPDLLIADEPTTALDAQVQMQVLDLLEDIGLSHRLSVLLITHDMGVVAGFAEQVMVMYSGRIVEDAPVDRLFAAPLHPYTRCLLDAVPRHDRVADRLPAVPGAPVPPALRPPGCAFHPRCVFATDICRSQVPALRNLPDGRRVACHHAATETA